MTKVLELSQVEKVAKKLIAEGEAMTENNLVINSLFVAGGTVSEAEAKQFIKKFDIKTVIELKESKIKSLEAQENKPPFIYGTLKDLKKEVQELKRSLNNI